MQRIHNLLKHLTICGQAGVQTQVCLSPELPLPKPHCCPTRWRLCLRVSSFPDCVSGRHIQVPGVVSRSGCVFLQLTNGIPYAIMWASVVNRQALKRVPSEGPEQLLLRDQTLSGVATSGRQVIHSDRWLWWKIILRLCDTIISVFTTKALNWALFDQKRRNKQSWSGGREIAKFKCNCSHCFVLRWMVGLTHYSPSTDILPRAIWQPTKINHNQDVCRHCHSESMALGAECGRKYVHWPHWGRGREKKEGLEKGKQKKSNKNSTSASTLLPSARLWRELMCLWVLNRSEGRQMASYWNRLGGRLWM